MVLVLRRPAQFVLALGLLGLSLGALPAPAVSAAMTYTVDALTDTGTGSGTTGDLRYAITQVDAGAGTGDTINIMATGTIALGSTLPTLTKPVTINGPGAALLAIDGGCTTCDPGGAHTDGVQVFVIGTVTATITGLTVQHGNTTNGDGGGITSRSGGTLTVRDAVVARNVGSGPGGGTGGIVNYGGSTLIVDRATFEGNSGGNGGGICNCVQGTLTVTNSTFANNRGGLGGAIDNIGQASVAATTISNNSAYQRGGGIHTFAPLTLAGSIVAGNTAPSGTDVSITVVYGTLTDGGYNLIGSPDGNAFVDGANHDRVGTVAAPLDPQLGPLASNGGPTQTFALLPGSPALDAIPAGTLGCGAALAVDQRAVPRPQGGGCERGAFEARINLAVTGGGTQAARVGTPFAIPLQVMVGAQDAGAAVSGVPVIFVAPGAAARRRPSARPTR